MMTASMGVNKSVVTAFDMVHSLTQIKNRKRLDLRFAYFHLNRVINTAAEVAYTDTYLNARAKSSNISRRQLTEYVCRDQRWYSLAGPSPLLLSVYSNLAETIVYVLPAYFVIPSMLNLYKASIIQ